MQEIVGNIWHFVGSLNPICIPTNGIYNSQGTAIMGAGLAKDAADRYPELPKLLGEKLKDTGNNVYQFNILKDIIITFPTKYHWYFKSNLILIRQSTEQLLELTDNNPDWEQVYLPRVGTGLGQLDWINDVKPILENLDDRFTIVSQ